MFTKEELDRGAKRAVLEYLAENGIPTSEIIPMEDASYFSKYSPLIVRSDGACQWDGFSGIFESLATNGNTVIISGLNAWTHYPPREFSIEALMAIVGLNAEYRSGKKFVDDIVQYNIMMIEEQIKWYCNGLDLAIPPKPHLLIQEAHGSGEFMFQHPSNPALTVLSVGNRTIIYNRELDNFRFIIAVWDKSVPPEEGLLRKVIEFYDKAVALPKLADYGVSFEMEFGLHRKDESPIVYQLKPFRKVETCSFSLETRSGPDIANFDIPFGITPKEGITLSYAEIPYLEKHRIKSYSGRVGFFYPTGEREGRYHHVLMPGLDGLIAPILKYKTGHGVREPLSKIPICLCNTAEYNGEVERPGEDTAHKDYRVAELIYKKLVLRRPVKLTSDGKLGQLEFL